MIEIIDEKDKWFLKRHGRFTASEIGKLLSKGTGTNMFGTGAWTYIKQKAIEKMTVLWERPELDEVKSLLHGKVHEQPAYEMYKRVTNNNSMRYFGSETPLFLEHNEDSGGSPDGLMGEGDRIYCGLELKCPKNSHIHWDYFKMKDQWDLRAYNIDNYAQVQFLLLITNADEFHFFSFDDRFIDIKKKFKLIPVLPDKKFQDNLTIRIQMAVKHRNQIIEEAFS
jgi:hypothetical protein